jgi:adenylyltransferase/sulfurtransferase
MATTQLLDKISEEQFYHRQLILDEIGKAGQMLLRNARVLVVGAGGLGCPCLTYLATLGVGTLGIADFDKVSLSNLHRQILYTIQDIGKPKTEVAAIRLKNLNPFIQITQHQQMVQEHSVLNLIQDYDIIVDGTDNFLVRYILNDACVYAGKPLVYGSVYKTEGNVTVFNYQNSASLRDLFPEESLSNQIPNCTETGAYNMLTGIIGMMMGNEVAKIILKKSGILAEKLLVYDALRSTIQTIGYKSLPDNHQKSMNRFQNQELPLQISVEELAEKLKNQPETLLLDVREDWERETVNIGGIHIPLGEIADRFNELPINSELIVYCHHGIRSLNAVQFLRQKGYKKTSSLQGGIHEWAITIDPEMETY